MRSCLTITPAGSAVFLQGDGQWDTSFVFKAENSLSQPLAYLTTSRGRGMGWGRPLLPGCCSPTNNTTRLSKQASSRQMARRPNAVGKKQPPRKPSLEAAVALLRQRYGGRLTPP